MLEDVHEAGVCLNLSAGGLKLEGHHVQEWPAGWTSVLSFGKELALSLSTAPSSVFLLRPGLYQVSTLLSVAAVFLSPEDGITALANAWQGEILPCLTSSLYFNLPLAPHPPVPELNEWMGTHMNWCSASFCRVLFFVCVEWRLKLAQQEVRAGTF